MTKMIVIGAGLMGASVAFRLVQAGRPAKPRCRRHSFHSGMKGAMSRWCGSAQRPGAARQSGLILGFGLWRAHARWSAGTRPAFVEPVEPNFGR